MQRQDVKHHTPAEVRDILRDALAIVDELEPADDLRVATFDQAARMLSGKEVVLVQPQPIDLSGLRAGPGLHG